MLTGSLPWPEPFAARYRSAAYWLDESFWDMLCGWAERHGERIALVDGAQRWSYQQLQRRAASLAAGLHSIGIGPQQRVVVQLPNGVEFVALCFALFRLGAIPVMALPAHRHGDIGHLCRHSGAVAYVTAARHGRHDNRPMTSEVRRLCPGLRHTIIAGGDPGEHMAFADLYHDSLPDASLPPPPAAGAVALFQLSGGTTGSPKLIPRTHADYAYSIRASADICQLDADTIYLAVLPVAHNFPLSSPGILGVLHAGGRVVMAQSGDPELAFELIARERVTITAMVPPLALMWMEQVAALQPDLSSLRLLQVGGAKLSEEAARRVPALLGCRLQQVFGMAEGLVCYTRHDDPAELVYASQGRPISPDDEIRIVDDDDAELPAGSVGHLLTRGPYTIRGYFDAPEHNARAFTADGFYRTGDLVRQLPSGHLVVEGRAKDLINRGGDKVAAEEIENLLLGHPAIVDVALVAMPDPFLGERSCAFVIARGLPPDLAGIKRFLRDCGVAEFKLPDRLELLPAFAHTSVGKVSKKALRELIAAKLEAEQAGVAEAAAAARQVLP
ncbi:(2,3-dihydroxybenzoyl)adenylate synthase [Massilia sp. BJB1822]|uniref:(2,3-dihydroxybenzoyl)adenylate synthase n=1 Tax=Massilia sp. BJB1822 TaxID=2744470 RepID=UPI001594E55A|nr:AMP-binding protein [Massilia sp. BJB1822]NVE00062.1 AMP-binding protein [Massilia sp. BJB1822]